MNTIKPWIGGALIGTLVVGNTTTAAAAKSAGKNEKAQQPNILLINIDDLGWSDLSFMEGGYYETPNIDKLRSEGIYFPNAYAAASNSAPSRASMLTGVFSSRHGVYSVEGANTGDMDKRKFIAAPNSATPDPSFELLPERMQAAGYNTLHVGKWHIGDDPTQQGIDVNIGGNMMGHPKSYWSPYNNPDLSDGEKGEYLTDRLTDETMKFLTQSRDKDKPFFIYFATYAVHTPIQPKPELVKKYEAKVGTEAHNKPKYAALVDATDQNIGRLLECIRENGLEENTVVIFTSDNGGLIGQTTQRPLRAGKGSFYEGGIRVPFIVKWCDKVKPNTTNDTPIYNLDIYPTILNISGVNDKGLDLDGVDITKLILDKGDIKERSLYWHFPNYLQKGNEETTDRVFRARPLSVVRRGDWKLIYNYETQITELYNLRNDISERENLAESEPEIREMIYTDLQSWLKSVNAPTTFELNPQYNEELDNRLKN